MLSLHERALSGAEYILVEAPVKPMCVTHVVALMRRISTVLDPADFLPLRPVELEILVTLAAGERHGYAIIQETEARTDGALRLETGTMYRALHRLVKTGLARPTARRAVDESDDERRRYYAITDLGRRVASAESARLARLVAAARSARFLPQTRPL